MLLLLFKEGIVMSIHDGHRGRMKQRFLEHGDAVFSDHQLLELLLFYSVPQGDVSPLAHRLMEQFGSFSGVLDASMDELQQVKGVGTHTAFLLSLLPSVLRRYKLSRSDERSVISSFVDAGEYLLPYFFGMRNEAVYLLSLDAKGQVLHCSLLAEGDFNRVNVNMNQVLETALFYRAASVILAHNHVGGLVVPSQEDILLTLALRSFLASHGVQFLDHIIIAEDDFSSFAESGLLIESS